MVYREPAFAPAAVSALSVRSVHGELVMARVTACHRFGVYLDVTGEVLPVLTSDAAALPTAVRIAERAGEVDWGVAPGDEVLVGVGRVRFPSLVLVASRTWRPARVRVLTHTDTARTSAGSGWGRGEQDGSGWLVDGIRAAVGTTDPGEAVARLLGRGPGLTPAGDDALAGAVLVEVALGGPTVLADAVRPRLSATTAVSRALLSAACDGYAAPPVVALVDAAVVGDRDTAAGHLPRVLAIGHTSGRDLVTGVLAALEVARPTSWWRAA